MVKWGKKFFILPALITTIIFLQSCSSDPVQSIQTVRGQVGYDFGYLSNAKVEIDGKLTTTDEEGRFLINDVTLPYDMKILTSNGLDLMIINEVSNPNPFVNFEQGYFQTTTKMGAEIEAELDSLPATNQRVFSVFVPDDGQPKVLSYYAGSAPGNIIRTDVYWIGSPSVKGKLIIYVYTVAGDRIVKFDKAYIKDDLTVNDNSTPSVLFNFPTAFPLNTSVSGFVDNGGQSVDLRMKLKFKNSITQHPISQVSSAQSFYFLVPDTATAGAFDVEVEALTSGGYSKRIVSPGTHDINFSPLSPVQLVSPENNTIGNLTSIIYSWQSPSANTGLYMLDINSTGSFRRIRIYTPRLNVQLPDLSAIGFSIGQTKTFSWKVANYYGFNNTGSFLNGNYTQSASFRGFMESETRSIDLF